MSSFTVDNMEIEELVLKDKALDAFFNLLQELGRDETVKAAWIAGNLFRMIYFQYGGKDDVEFIKVKKG